MADKSVVNEKNCSGAWFVTDPDAEDQGCISCGVCYSNSPEYFGADDFGAAYVKRQPQTESELLQCQEQCDACPVEAIGVR